MELIPGNKYKLKYTDQFCHLSTDEGPEMYDSLLKEFKEGGLEATYVGQIEVEVGERNIFYLHGLGATYIMMDGKKHEKYILTEEKEKLIKKFQDLKEEMKEVGITIKMN